MPIATRTSIFLLLLSSACVSASAKEIHATIVYDDKTTEISSANEEAGQLWITTDDLDRATGFEVKPQGVCQGKLCFPIPKSREQEFLRKQQAKTWFNLIAFAQLVRQPFAHDEALAT